MISRLRLFWRQIRGHWIIVIIAALVVVLALIVTGYIFNWDWLGLNGYNKVTIATDLSSSPPKSTRTIEYQPGKTLWDWLQLIIVPVALGIITFWFNSLQKNIEDQRAQTQKEIEDQRAITQEQAGVLNTYIDDMSKLLLERNLRHSLVGDEVRIIAQTKTLTALDRLNLERRVRVLKFLYEAKLLEKADPLIDLSAENYLEGLDLSLIKLEGAHLERVSLKDTNLSGAKLARANLEAAHLEGANLSYAQLVGANLFMATLDKATTLYRTDFIDCNLETAVLQGVDLTEAMGFENLRARAIDLRDADLRGLNLRNADLGKAHLEGANLENADLTGARIYEGNLKGANLRNATLTETELYDADLTDAVVTDEQLEEVTTLSGATLPNGTKNQETFLDELQKLREKLMDEPKE